MTLKRIHLELARDHDYPTGRRDCGYDFLAPLDADGHIDAQAWHAQRARCRVRRFWAGQPDEIGHLIRKPGGAWAFHYDVLGDPEDDETGYRFGTHAFVDGEYISINEHDDKLRTFRVAAVTDAG
ncbi:MAG: hypothetical protein R3F55_12655 [Alphaproteobacteria bacterium]